MDGGFGRSDVDVPGDPSFAVVQQRGDQG